MIYLRYTITSSNRRVNTPVHFSLMKSGTLWQLYDTRFLRHFSLFTSTPIIIFAELPCCRPCENTGGYLANISLPTTCEQTPKDCQKLGARCCRGPRVEGCSCPIGTFFDGKKCVNQTSECERPCVTTTVVTPTTTSVSSSSSVRWVTFYASRNSYVVLIVTVS